MERTQVVLLGEDLLLRESLERVLAAQPDMAVIAVCPIGEEALLLLQGQRVDLIVLDSPDDAQHSSAIQMALPQAANVCVGLKACPANVPAIVPSQVGGVHREGAKMFVDFLQKTPAS